MAGILDWFRAVREWLTTRLVQWIKRLVIKSQYEYLNRLDRDEKLIRFLNYGYTTLDPNAPRIELEPAEEPNRLAIQLYHYMASAVEIAGKDVLEVGCGRGGGAAYVARRFTPRSYVGVDLWKGSIDFCNEEYHVEGLSFRIADAQELPFDDASFDVVINVESSHLYDDIDGFLIETGRVLRPGGYFLFADFRTNEAAQMLREQIAGAGLELVREDTINENVVAALDLDNDRKTKLIEERLPKRRREQFAIFAALKGTYIYEHLKAGDIEYFRMVIRKPER